MSKMKKEIKSGAKKMQRKVSGYIWKPSSTIMKEAVMMAIDFWQPVTLVIVSSLVLNAVLSTILLGLELQGPVASVFTNTVLVINLLFQLCDFSPLFMT